MLPEHWFALAALAVALVALGFSIASWYTSRTAARALSEVAALPPTAGAEGELIAFVANPSKPDVADFEEIARTMCREAALPDPLWIETTPDDPGIGQTREALEKGAKLVVAVGGDGTVRAVAEALVDTGTPMALVPSGTGNLLARNLDVPVGDHIRALRRVIAGVDRTIDVGWMTVTEWAEGEEPEDPDAEFIFLVIGGLGFDAAMVADTDDQLKARMGWMAYFFSGVRHLHGRRMRTQITIDDHEPVEARLRSLMIGNCGRLPGGINLIPDAVIDDGILDVTAIDTRGGIAGWAQLFGEVVMQGFGVSNDLPAKIGKIEHARARTVTVRVEEGQQAQVDGDLIGKAVELKARVQPSSLVVRTA
ncbi:Diacylglycerol kinase family enzyme [Paraoerskovia marina]|uniref:Diacylglycerol kinase family enzyme n=1 Tax=Paraoerskovia marina TaxID=545619 RepID=A0A1H1P3C5_9CELL|nr:diacylglycerol kinase family protein [Paraoerskovia marina]SDS05692.1 Diacylglycerol kinase family enzyme [Paraoerskovia marina]